ncbi:hypothetical protein F2Q68_00045391 [Brassica cretica]|uniref:Uncharacterized protein n=1 Tax=Brassica cretica TaxID=69181 RepID=A0A8S9LR22_BRACR|nr:hypothetical protein F2Q68_00045391 [Brassica cretica]
MAAGSAKNLSSFSSRQPHDSVSSGNFSNLKFTAETGEGTGVFEIRSRIGGLCFFDLESLLSIPIAYPVLYTNLNLIDVLKRIVFLLDVLSDLCSVLRNSKLKKSKDHILALEEKLQSAFNENAKLRVMQKEDEKLWRGMESKFSSTKTLCDQLTETLQHLASQVQEGI